MLQFSDLYRGYNGNHGTSTPTGNISSEGKVEHKHFTKKGAPTEAEWNEHLSGGPTGLGIIPLLDDDSSVYWGALDIDKYKGAIDFVKLEADISALPLTITKSKSGGAHLWLFCAEPISARLVITRLAEWAAALGFGGCEVFPKQHTRLKGTNDTGNWINIPYFGKTRHAFIEGQEVELDKFLEVAETRLVNEKVLRKIRIASATAASEVFLDGPPCLETIFSKGSIEEGGRNNTLFNVGIYFKKKDEDNWQAELTKFNDGMVNPPLPPSEVRASIKTIERKPYNFTCSKHPINQVCNRPLCIKREFGVANGAEEGANAEMNIILSGLTKINTSEPRWLVNIDGIRAEIPDTGTLMDQKKFGNIVVERVHKVLNGLPAKKWNEEIQRLLNQVEVIEAPAEASVEGRFAVYLINFIESRGTDVRDRIALGNVWLCPTCNSAYFRMQDLQQYIQREGFRDLKPARMFELLNNSGLTHGRFNIKGKNTYWWKIPMPSLQLEAFNVPRFQSFDEDGNLEAPPIEDVPSLPEDFDTGNGAF